MFRSFRSQTTSALLASAFFVMAPAPVQADDLLVFAAASLTNALEDVAQSWMEETGNEVVMSFAGSSALARQIQQGAPADVFISASADWMDAIAASGDLRDDTRRDILGNSLVLIAHGRDVAPVTIDESLDLVGMLKNERLAMALVDSVPAGVYGKAALTSLGLWDEVEPLVAQSDNVRAALAFVARDEAPLGIVYATDAAVQDNVSIIGTFPPGSHPPITYPAGITAQSENPLADEFMTYLSSEAAQAVWREYGFSVLD